MNTVSAFCHIEKTGGTTIIKLLRSRLGISHVDLIPFRNKFQLASPKDLRYARIVNPGLKSVAGHSIRPCDKKWQNANVRWSALLRNPTERYISDFYHFTRHMSFPNDFELWLAWKDRHNFQARSLVGNEPVEVAIDSYERRDILLGTLPRINGFASLLLQNCGISPKLSFVELGVTNKGSQPKSEALSYMNQYAEQIQENNKYDWQLYSRVSSLEESNGGSFSSAPEVPSEHKNLEVYNKIWRNLVYKPSTLVNPIRTHGLRDYIEFSSWSEMQWRQYIYEK